MWSDKKKKHLLPFLDPEKAPEERPPERPYNPLAEKYAQAEGGDDRLKNYAILYLDRDVARSKGDPLITVVQAYSQAEAELRASELSRDGCEVLAVQSNEIVHFPAQESEFVFPKPPAQPDSDENGDSGEGGAILRRRRRTRSSY